MFIWITPPDHAPDTPPEEVFAAALGDAEINAPHFAEALRALFEDGFAAPLADVHAAIAKAIEAGEALAETAAHSAFRHLAKIGAVHLASGDFDEAVLHITPQIDMPLPAPPTVGAGVFRLSRFATAQRREEALTLERPMSGFTATIRTDTLTGSKLLALFTEGTPSDGLARGRIPSGQREAVCAVLLLAGIIQPVDENGLLVEDHDPVLRQWEPHDMAFHMRSRMGFHRNMIGASFRFHNELYAEPALHPTPQHHGQIPLPVPDMEMLNHYDIPLSRALEMRKSRRPQLRRALTLVELGLFLYRAARIKSHSQTQGGSFTARPYPSGGGGYESEIYITAQNVAGLAPGFYYYDAAQHALLLLRPWDEACAEIAQDAFIAMAQSSTPDAVLTFGSRFQRMQWKYSGMAYAAQLKSTGAAYMAFYLVATSMGLSPCGLGLGDAATFARLTGQNPLYEGSIGEFALSGPGDD